MWRLWYNGTVVSVDDAIRRYEAAGVEDGRLTFLGSVQEALAQAWDEIRGSQGGMVPPGFTDSHTHLLHYVMIQKNLSLFGVASIGEVTEWGRARIEWDHLSYPIGMGWNQEIMVEGRPVTQEDLDRISTGVPVCMLRVRLHIGACNSIMLERVRMLEDVAPGVLVLVDFSNGISREDAARLYMKALPQADDAYVKEPIRLGQQDLNAAGITCINSDDLKAIAGVDPIRLIGIFRKVEADGELTVRVYEQCLVKPGNFGWLQAVRSDPADRESLFRTGPRKLFQDGSLGVKSAEMIGGYLDEPDNYGILICTEEELCSWIHAAHTAHTDVAMHAIGDLVSRKVCDAIEWVEREEPWPDHRHGIVHAQTITPALLEWMKVLGLQAYIQPIPIDADMNIVAERVGEVHTRGCYNWKAMEDLGIRVSGGSNCPVEPFNVLDNLRAVVTRQNRAGTRAYLPEQALTMEQAVRLLTSDAARASQDEVVRGTLEPGKQVGPVVLDRDPFKISHQDFSRVKVLETVLNGVTVYWAETLQSVHSLDHRQRNNGERALWRRNPPGRIP